MNPFHKFISEFVRLELTSTLPNVTLFPKRKIMLIGLEPIFPFLDNLYDEHLPRLPMLKLKFLRRWYANSHSQHNLC